MLMINLASPGGKLEYTSTECGYPLQKDVAQVMALPPNDGITLISASEFSGGQTAGSSHENPVHLSDAIDASVSGLCPMKDVETEDEAVVLGHFSDALHKMATSIKGLEDGYFKALHEVIIETEKALCDMLQIDAHYVSRVVTVMNSWQEAVQTAANYMEGIDTAIYLAHREDAQKATKENVALVIQACQECNAAHDEEQKMWKEAIKADDFKDPVIHLLHITHKAAFAQAEKAIDAFFASIKSTLWKHIPVNAQGPLIASSKHGIPISDERVAHDRQGVRLPHVGEALGLVQLGRHHPGHSRDVL